MLLFGARECFATTLIYSIRDILRSTSKRSGSLFGHPHTITGNTRRSKVFVLKRRTLEDAAQPVDLNSSPTSVTAHKKTIATLRVVLISGAGGGGVRPERGGKWARGGRGGRGPLVRQTTRTHDSHLRLIHCRLLLA
ncbi:hypothetical protein EVAR_21635_1 [Eumeta japonica]|uniref:Uncharacterized protein n=1 Tax=Eumeta variegata TaxID=151549 RepID=A0A4C1UYV7_EUMVA|nr:hypothetical protein EVAR_21635_1 [Eumeta japonica]